MPSRKSSAPEPRRGKSAAAPAQLGLSWMPPALVAGVDEAGRGPLAGPVVAAAVILDELQPIEGLNDSKLLSPRTRERLFDEIRARALCCCIAEASVEEIDRLNILQATMLAMRRAVEGLRLLPRHVLVDGNRLPVLKVPAEAIIGGDAKVPAISAASILAKVYRDRLCLKLHEAHPLYGFDDHKGYGTPEHMAALQRHGPCAVHRQSFAPCREAGLAIAEGRAAVLLTMANTLAADREAEGVDDMRAAGTGSFAGAHDADELPAPLWSASPPEAAP